jgi:hypothetical protein
MVAYEIKLSNRKYTVGSLFYKLIFVNEVLTFAGNSEDLRECYVADVGVWVKSWWRVYAPSRSGGRVMECHTR